MTWLIGLCIAVGAAATVEDLWRRRVSNEITAGGFFAGLLAHSFFDGTSGALESLAGAGIGFGVFLVFFLLGGMGGGDIKLMAAFGAILGGGQVLLAAILTALIGGLLAAGYLAWYSLSRRRGAQAAKDGAPRRRLFIPYAPAISLGALLSFLGNGKPLAGF